MIANPTQVEMVIKEISSVGADVRAGNELDFREIFRDSRHVFLITTTKTISTTLT